MSNSEDLILQLPTVATTEYTSEAKAVTLDDLYYEFCEERAANRQFMEEMRGLLSSFTEKTHIDNEPIVHRAVAIEQEARQRLVKGDRRKVVNAQGCLESRVEVLEKDVALLKAALYSL